MIHPKKRSRKAPAKSHGRPAASRRKIAPQSRLQQVDLFGEAIYGPFPVYVEPLELRFHKQPPSRYIE